MKFELDNNEKILIVAPHPDDESIGCGGLLNIYNKRCDVLLITDGKTDKPENKKEMLIRENEFKAATGSCRVDKVFMLHIPVFQIKNNFSKILEIDFSRYKYVFLPNRYEYHQDHVDTYFSVKKAIKTKKSRSIIIEYEIWTTIRFPNLYVDISDVIEEKTNAINQHKTQIKSLDFNKFILGLNTYRGLSKGYKCAEAYYCESEYRKEKARQFKRKIKKIIKH